MSKQINNYLFSSGSSKFALSSALIHKSYNGTKLIGVFASLNFLLFLITACQFFAGEVKFSPDEEEN